MSNPYLKAMKFIKNDEWTKAHDIIEKLNTPLAAQIHGFLHRIEGDQWNANYWYQRAKVSTPDCSLEEEWVRINNSIPKE